MYSLPNSIDSTWTTRVGNYSRPSFPVSDLEKWDIMPYRLIYGKLKRFFSLTSITAVEAA